MELQKKLAGGSNAIIEKEAKNIIFFLGDGMSGGNIIVVISSLFETYNGT
jgi:alkaline phosphatase